MSTAACSAPGGRLCAPGQPSVPGCFLVVGGRAVIPQIHSQAVCMTLSQPHWLHS